MHFQVGNLVRLGLGDFQDRIGSILMAAAIVALFYFLSGGMAAIKG